MNPCVSIFMPTYNQGALLQRALDGLAKQAFRDFELVVCNDASTDNTSEVLNEEVARGRLDMTVLNHSQNQGAAAAINTCSRKGRGRIWTWVSSDNVMLPSWLEKLVPELDEQKKAGAAFSAYTNVGRSRRGVFKKGGCYRPGDLISTAICFFGPSFLILGEVWKGAGEFRGAICCDYDHWTRVEEECWRRGLGITYVPVSLCDYFIGPWQATFAKIGEFDAHKWRAEAIARRKGKV